MQLHRISLQLEKEIMNFDIDSITYIRVMSPLNLDEW